MDIVALIENLLLHAGTAWVLVLLIVLSVASVALAIERGLALRVKRGDADSLAKTFETSFGEGIEQTTRAIASDVSSGAQVLRAGLKFADGGIDAASHAMDAALAKERSQLESRIAFLGTLGNNAPFIGLFGTVIGVISAFDELGNGGGSGVDSAGSALVMGAIAEALVATAVGIAVALPAVFAYNLLQRRIAAICTEVDALTSLFLAHLARRDAEKS